MNIELFHPAPTGLPVPIRPPRGSNETLKSLERLDWTNLAKARNGELLRAGALWLHGFLDESHSIAQGIPFGEGSYWHALMHRSEGDFSNSKYWYRRVGRHAIFPDLLGGATAQDQLPIRPRLVVHESEDWDPFRFVDAMEHAASHKTEDTARFKPSRGRNTIS